MLQIIFSVIFAFFPLLYTLGTTIEAGGNFSLALKEDGTVWGWGENDGQLGDGTGSDRLTPVQASGLTDVISISAGYEHSLVLKRDGTVWAFGWNELGELGDGTSGPYNKSFSPVQVVGLSGVMAVAAGDHFSLALKNDGTAWGWGVNTSGQLGIGTSGSDDYRVTPVQVVGLSNAIAISAGARHSLALKRDGTVWTWGAAFYRELEKVYLTPELVSEFSDVTAISAGGGHSLVLKRDGTVWGWGADGRGQLGDGNTNWYTLTPAQSLLSGVIAIASGSGFSLAHTSYGTIWFCGSIAVGFPLPADPIESIIPVPVDGISGVEAIAAGNNHALFLKNDGIVWALGDNLHGQLGDGTSMNYRRYPVQVKGFSTGGSATVPATVLAADFDEDGKADPTAISSSGELFYWNSSQSFSRDGPIELGTSGSVAVGDADGDGQADMAIVSGNPSTGSGQVWYFYLSSRGYLAEAQNLQPSVHSPQPLLADFDGDGKADPAIVSATGVWYFWLSADNYSPVSAPFAISGATPVAADFDADGRADPVMVTSSGDWYLWPSGSMYTKKGPYNFQITGKPVAGDFDGDRKADPGIVDSTGNWNLFLSAALYTRSGPWYLVLP